MDYSHYLYNKSKIEKKAKKNNKGNIIKELKLSSKISEHDFQVRLKAGIKFLEKGYKIKVSLMFKGREITHSELGISVMDKFIENIKNEASIEQPPSLNGKFITMILGPKKK
jgi:translation initiation factor IF-3